MSQQKKDSPGIGSSVDHYYSSGEYFANVRRHIQDSEFKATSLLKVLLKFAQQNKWIISSYADVGCGSGEIVKIIADSLREHYSGLIKVRGYDVSPHVKNIKHDGVEYIQADFCESDTYADLVTLFDVF